jgi:hypothetical protein
VAAALEELGVQAIRQRQAEPGVRFLAAAAALRHLMGAPARPVDQPTVGGALAVARAALGDDAFSGAWDAGETLPLEQFIARLGDDM